MGALEDEKIFSSVYAAASGRVDWQQPLTLVKKRLGLWGAQIIGADKRTGGLVFSAESDLDQPQVALDYIRFYHSINPRMGPTLALGPGEWMHCHEHFNDQFVAKDRFYQELLLPYGGRYLSGTKLIEDDNVLFLFGALRGQGSAPIGPAEMPFLDKLKHHLTEALRNVAHQRNAHTELDIARALLGRFDYPMFLVDEMRGVWHSNEPAHKLARQGQWLAVKDGILVCRSGEDNAALTDAIHSLDLTARLDKVDTTQRRVVRLTDARGDPLLLFVSAVRPEHSSQMLGPQAKALVIAHHPHNSAQRIDPLLLAECFALTPAEARVAARLAEGRTAKEIAQEHGTSLATTRTHIQHVLEKVGVDRQGELLRVLGAMAIVS